MAQILVLRPGFEPGLSDRKSDGLNRWPNGAYFVVPSSGVEPDFWDFQSRPFPRLDAEAYLVLRPRFELGLTDRKSVGLNRWPNGAYKRKVPALHAQEPFFSNLFRLIT